MSNAKLMSNAKQMSNAPMPNTPMPNALFEHFPTNPSIYIKRAENHHDIQYITNAFKLFGIIDLIQLIPRRNEHGQTYNAVIVFFKHWFINNQVKLFWLSLHDSPNGHQMFHSTKFFWITTFHKHTSTPLSIAPTLPITPPLPPTPPPLPPKTFTPIIIRTVLPDINSEEHDLYGDLPIILHNSNIDNINNQSQLIHIIRDLQFKLSLTDSFLNKQIQTQHLLKHQLNVLHIQNIHLSSIIEWKDIELAWALEPF